MILSAKVLKISDEDLDLIVKDEESILVLNSIFLTLASLLGNNIAHCVAWFHAYNDHLKGSPINISKEEQGLSKVLKYLEKFKDRSP